MSFCFSLIAIKKPLLLTFCWLQDFDLLHSSATSAKWRQYELERSPNCLPFLRFGASWRQIPRFTRTAMNRCSYDLTCSSRMSSHATALILSPGKISNLEIFLSFNCTRLEIINGPESKSYCGYSVSRCHSTDKTINSSNASYYSDDKLVTSK